MQWFIAFFNSLLNYRFMKQEDALKKPFFAKMLEQQQKAQDEQNYWPITSPFKDAYTNKYPSDGDDDIRPEPF
jgi:hypothetical protein